MKLFKDVNLESDDEEDEDQKMNNLLFLESNRLKKQRPVSINSNDIDDEDSNMIETPKV